PALGARRHPARCRAGPLRLDRTDRLRAAELELGFRPLASISACFPPAGASPSGKAPVFGTGIRRFESCRPSQPSGLRSDGAELPMIEPQVVWDLAAE